ncbi:unnamed protein product, partial [Closterium sp. Yama58-4]
SYLAIWSGSNHYSSRCAAEGDASMQWWIVERLTWLRPDSLMIPSCRFSASCANGSTAQMK